MGAQRTVAVTERSHRTWGDGAKSALVAAEFAALVLLVSLVLLTILYLVALASL
jgi:hypothetical protein